MKKGKINKIAILSVLLTAILGALLYFSAQYNDKSIETDYTGSGLALEKDFKLLTDNDLKKIKGDRGYLEKAKVISVPWKMVGLLSDSEIAIELNYEFGVLKEHCTQEFIGYKIEENADKIVIEAHISDSEVSSSYPKRIADLFRDGQEFIPSTLMSYGCSKTVKGFIKLKQPLGNRKLYHGKVGEVK
jgi:hypothetical protein